MRPRWLGALVGLLAAHLAAAVTFHGAPSPEVSEYCEWESFNATCPPGGVVLISSAIYGRMALGRCVKKNYGNIGCGTDVSADFDARCSGSRSCVIDVISLHKKRSCPADFKSYLEAGYECLSVSDPYNVTCRAPITLTASSGSIASVVTMDTAGLGGDGCPWVIRVAPYQRINLTMTDYSLPPGEDAWYPYPRAPHAACRGYANISEENDTMRRTVCGGRQRESAVYVTKGNVLEVKVISEHLPKHRFLLKYQAFGCAPLLPPVGAWLAVTGEHAVVRCNDTADAWYLTCRGTEWVGTIGNCSLPPLPVNDEDWRVTSVLDSVSHFPFGILIVVALGVAIGVAIGVMMLVAVLAYMKRRRRRKVRSRSAYTLKPLSDTNPYSVSKLSTDPSIGDLSPMLQKPDTDTGASHTLPRTQRTHSNVNTWRRQPRPLQVPGHTTSDSGIDPEMDGLTMTPESPAPSVFTTFRPEFEREIAYMVTPPNAYITEGSFHPHPREGPYYFKLDPSAAQAQREHSRALGKPDVVTGACVHKLTCPHIDRTSC